MEFAQHNVAIGDRQRPAVSIARRARMGAGGIRADAVAGAVEMQDGAAAGGHGVNQHHRRAQPHPGHFGFKGALEFAIAERAVVVADVRGSAAHVKADDPLETRRRRHPGHAHHAARRPGQHRVLALKKTGVGQPTAGAHEHQPPVRRLEPRQLRRHLFNVTAQNRRQVGVHHGGVAPGNQFHQRAGDVAHRNLRKARFAGDFGELVFVFMVAVAVHQNDGGGTVAVRVKPLQPALGAVSIQRNQYFTGGVNALVHLKHRAVQHLRQLDVQRKQVGSGLITDAQGVGESPGDDQQRALATALQQGIGGHGGAHFDRGDTLAGQRAMRAGLDAGLSKNIFDALNRRILILPGIFRQQFMSNYLTVGPPRHHIGKSATAVDPEFPFIGRQIGHWAGFRSWFFVGMIGWAAR